jgi:hypothetical protein
MSKIFEKLTGEEDAVMQWQYGYCGDFDTALWKAIGIADDYNLLRLGTGFPLHVDAYRLYSRSEGWWDEVRAKAIELGYLEAKPDAEKREGDGS